MQTVFFCAIFRRLSHNVSYGDETLSSTVTSDSDYPSTDTKYGDVFVEGDATVQVSGCDASKCITTCSCKEANGWYDSAASANPTNTSSVYKVASTRGYGTSNVVKTCYKKKLSGAEYFYVNLVLTPGCDNSGVNIVVPSWSIGGEGGMLKSVTLLSVDGYTCSDSSTIQATGIQLIKRYCSNYRDFGSQSQTQSAKYFVNCNERGVDDDPCCDMPGPTTKVQSVMCQVDSHNKSSSAYYLSGVRSGSGVTVCGATGLGDLERHEFKFKTADGNEYTESLIIKITGTEYSTAIED
jgi:hypothetical protein